MRLGSFPVLGLLALTAACSAATEGASTDTAAITGSLGDARACQVADVYRSAKLTDFEFLDVSALPFPVTGHPSVVARFDAGVGKVYVVEVDGSATFYALNGDAIATRELDSNIFTKPTGESLVCEAPTLATVTPASVVSGAPDTTVRIAGAGFDARSIVNLDGQALPTTFVSATALDATVNQEWLSGFGRRSVITVSTPGKGETIGIGFDRGNPKPEIGTPSPLGARLSGPSGTVVSVPGASFVPGTVIELTEWPDGLPVARFDTTFVSTKEVTFALATMPPEGSYALCVETPQPGGGRACFTVDLITGSAFEIVP